MITEQLRELDAWIAENVTKWKGCDCKNGILKKFGQAEYERIRGMNPEWQKWPKKEPDIKCDHFPRYTTEPAAAMDVLKKCAEKVTVTIEFTSRNTLGKPQWMVAKLEPEKQCEIFCTCAETLELAICLFAKKLFSK